MTIAVEIGDIHFDTKTAAKVFFKEMLARYKDGENIKQEDSVYLYSLIERHPEESQKIGCGIKRFYRKKTSHGTSCFWLERTDGCVTEFSYGSCVDAKGKTLYQEFAEACRESVKEDLFETKRQHFKNYGNEEGKVPCDITGEMIGLQESHLDHKKPMTFQVIVRTFLAANGIKLSRDILTEPQDQQVATTFTDQEIARKFAEYHHKVADLRIIKNKLNLSLGGSERIQKSNNPVTLVKASKNDN